MNLKLLFFCLVLALLVIPAELKPKKHKKHHHRDHEHGHGHKPNKKRVKVADIIRDLFFEILEGRDDGDDDDDDDRTDWLFDIQEPEGLCNPNPCRNNGVCEEKDKRKFKCDCPIPFKGKKCQKGPKHCKKGRCGRGECVLTSIPPYYECKCKEPFQPPRCVHMSLCEPNPCRNGGQCINDGNDFECECPLGFRGRFCHVGPDDCYDDDGESYRGKVSETDDGQECLYWNSHFILDNGVDPFNSFEDSNGLGPHNFCRNPDGDNMPWCFFRKGRKLSWDYCDVTECPEPTGVAPTEIVPAVTDPTPSKPQTAKPEPIAPTESIKPTAPSEPIEPTAPSESIKPTAPFEPIEPTTTEKPSQAPQPSPTPTADVPLTPTATVTPQQFRTCGKPQPKKPLTRIFGGLKISPGAVPWQVSLQMRPQSSSLPFRHICGGVLIASCWVLTAGHCIEPAKDMQVVVGGLSLNMVETTEQTLQVEEAIRHENYRETPAAVYNDIALLRLKGTDGVCAIETQFVKTACLPDAQLPDGMECKISGWGATENSSYGSNHLLDADVLLINQEKCSERQIYGNVLDNSMFCAGHLQGGVDSCQGDSGGPLTCEQNSTSVIYGLVSWGDQCGRKNKPGVYTQVTHFLDWIKSKTQAF
ncbi:hyaluronan-binding protein 2-like isoform X1 [Sebastes umbrosus]|uniref:hyaluronan-binding protein 2-like isoform X1 n=1 Tax=Sebastes umbrosus TaxID=72105 RepID=UPI00189E5EC4|nr:hyaluronan-binding protein 2-like isoform X1 [Sebastes umbrosus]